jgi:hypothetical protein
MQSPLLSRADRYRYYQICFYSPHRRRRGIAFAVAQALFQVSAIFCAPVVMAKRSGGLARQARNQEWPSKDDISGRGQGGKPLASVLPRNHPVLPLR